MEHKIKEILQARIDKFDSIYHSYEAKELRQALNAIQRLVPPDHWNSISQPLTEAEIQRRALEKYPVRMSVGRRGMPDDANAVDRSIYTSGLRDGSKSDAVEFAEWIHKGTYYPGIKDFIWNKVHSDVEVTTTELYEIFKKEPG